MSFLTSNHFTILSSYVNIFVNFFSCCSVALQFPMVFHTQRVLVHIEVGICNFGLPSEKCRNRERQYNKQRKGLWSYRVNGLNRSSVTPQPCFLVSLNFSFLTFNVRVTITTSKVCHKVNEIIYIKHRLENIFSRT